jgi:outer membrane protein assembly factor BamB
MKGALLVRATIFALIVFISSASTFADNWPFFRGPQRTGISSESSAPTTWDTEKNIKWKAPLPSPGNSSPVVWGDRVFVTSAENAKGSERSLYCFSRADGHVLWVKTVRYEKKEPTHETNPYSASSPAADAQRVVVWHGSAGVYCYDHSGAELWHRDLGTFNHIWGYASSPVIVGDSIFMNCGPGNRTFVTALDAKDGHTIWETPEAGGADDKSAETKSWIGSWSSPVPATIDGKQQILVALPRHVNAYDPANGKIIWYCEGNGDLSYTDPLIGDGIAVYLSGFGGPGIGFKLGGVGNVTATNRLWRDTNKIPQRIGSGLIIGPNLYQICEPGIIQCVEAGTNKELWKHKPEGETFWGSMVAVGNQIYVTSQSGTTIVFAADPKEFRQLAKNPLGERSNSTPAISNGQIFIRTAGHLWCVEEK